MPENTVFVGARSKWATPYKIENVRRRDRRATSLEAAGYLREIVELYRRYITKARPELVAAAKVELAGKNLACSCPLGLVCHADILLEIANSGEVRES
jgi:hypothetical protein